MKMCIRDRVWDDSDPSGSVKQFVDESITEETEALVRRKPYYSHEPSGDFIYRCV